MELSFKNEQLRNSYEQFEKAVNKWGPQVARKYVTRVEQLYAVSNFQEIFKIRAMHFHPLKGPYQGKYAITLAGRWRLIVSKGDSEERLNIEEVSNHYGD